MFNEYHFEKNVCLTNPAFRTSLFEHGVFNEHLFGKNGVFNEDDVGKSEVAGLGPSVRASCRQPVVCWV